MNSNNLKVYKADVATGRCTATVISSGVPKNVFNYVTSAQRNDGHSQHVKTFWGLDNTDNLPLLDPEAYHDKPTLSPDDFVVMWESAQRTLPDESSLATEMSGKDLFGSADLAADYTASDAYVDVVVKHADQLPGGQYDIFKDTYEIKICSHSNALATDGNEEEDVINGAPTVVSGLTVRIVLTTTFSNSYTVAEGTRVSSRIRSADTETSYDSLSVSDSKTVDDTTYPIELDNQGTVEQDWTITFTSATSYTLSGDVLGQVGSGDTSTDFEPNNPDVSRNYLKIPAGFWNDTYATGNTVQFTTHPARLPIGQKLIVPPLSGSLANNVCTQVYGGEAAG